MSLTLREAKRRIDAIVDGYQQAAGASPASVLGNVTAGKVYEGWVLCEVLERLERDEGLRAVFVGGTEVALKSSPGPINSTYPHFRLEGGREPLEVWTDVEFLTLSYEQQHSRGRLPPERSEYHELDIVVVPAGTTDRPSHSDVRLGVECKNTPWQKEMLRALLGVRRELSWLGPPQSTGFHNWPAKQVPADPPSCLIAYCAHPNILRYQAPGPYFGVRLLHEGMR